MQDTYATKDAVKPIEGLLRHCRHWREVVQTCSGPRGHEAVNVGKTSADPNLTVVTFRQGHRQAGRQAGSGCDI